MLDVARQTYKEATEDAYQHINELAARFELPLIIKFDHVRQFYIRCTVSELEDGVLPEIFINAFRKKSWVECQTLELMKLNQKVCVVTYST